MATTKVTRRKTTMKSLVGAADPGYRAYRHPVYRFRGRIFLDPKKQPYET